MYFHQQFLSSDATLRCSVWLSWMLFDDCLRNFSRSSSEAVVALKSPWMLMYVADLNVSNGKSVTLKKRKKQVNNTSENIHVDALRRCDKFKALTKLSLERGLELIFIDRSDFWTNNLTTFSAPVWIFVLFFGLLNGKFSSLDNRFCSTRTHNTFRNCILFLRFSIDKGRFELTTASLRKHINTARVVPTATNELFSKI